MGILSLRFGFFAKLGAATVINDNGSELNHIRYSQLRLFNQFFFSRMSTLADFIPSNAQHSQCLFKVYADNFAMGTENLNKIQQADGRFSIVVYCVETDLLDNKLLADNYIEKTEEMYKRCKKLDLQIFSIKDVEYPLTTAVLNEKDKELPFYLMSNATNNRNKIGRRLNAI